MVGNGQLSVKATEIAVSRHCAPAVPRNVKFGHNADCKIVGIVNNLFNLSLRVKTAVFLVVKVGLFPHRTDLSEQWIFFNFNSPSLVFREMQMQKI